MTVFPFRAWRPAANCAQCLPSVPYDTVSRDEARRLADGNPKSFLHIVRSDIDLPDDADPHGAAVYALAKQALTRAFAEGWLVEDGRPSLFLYRQIMGDHAQAGIVGCCHIEDYLAGRIKRHEKTRQDKEDDRARHVLTLRAHTGPVFLMYRDNPELAERMAAAARTAPLSDVTAEDGVRHTVWRMADEAGVQNAFRSVPCFYIADGHHRAAAAVRVGVECGAGSAEAQRFLSALFPAGSLQVLPYHRIVRDLNGMSADTFLRRLGEVARIDEADTRDVPPARGSAAMYLAGRWRRVSLPSLGNADDPVNRLDVSLLQSRVLAPLLGIDNPRTNERIEFVGGIRGPGELRRRVDGNGGGVAFSMYPVSVNEVMDIADAGQCMPPKSTWFEPKLRSGFFVHTF